MSAWTKLIKQCAKGKPICNCGQAYLEPCGVGYHDGNRVENALICRGGCASAQISAKEYVAKQILGG